MFRIILSFWLSFSVLMDETRNSCYRHRDVWSVIHTALICSFPSSIRYALVSSFHGRLIPQVSVILQLAKKFDLIFRNAK